MSKKSETKQKATTYKVVGGDVLELFFNSEGDAALLHGANCQKVMGAGVADQIRNKVSPLFYLDQYDPRSPSQRYGSYSAVVLGAKDEKIKVGVNIYSQFSPGPDFNLTAFTNGLRSFVLSIPTQKRAEMTLYLPKIGCSIGGAKWEDVEPVVKRELASFNVVVVNYVKPVQTKTEEK